MSESALVNSALPGVRGWHHGIHLHERVALLYFSYLALLSLFHPITVLHRIGFFAVPLCIFALIRWETAVSRGWTRIARQWASLGLILIAYWLLAWITASPWTNLERHWIEWDESLLHTYGLKYAVESAGWFGPSLIETCYLLVYAIPPLSLGLIYRCGEKARANQYLAVLFLGTFTAYALLSLFPIVSPRLAFPESAPPSFHGVARRINTFILDRYDISTGVFPSGHVAVAFSSALGLYRAIRQRFFLWGASFLVAFLVYVDTIYGRYHYAVDGLASMCVVFFVWWASREWRTRAEDIH